MEGDARAVRASVTRRREIGITMPQPAIRTGLNALPTLAAAACIAATLGLADVVRADEAAPGGAQGPPTGDNLGQRYRNVTGPDVQRLLLKLGYAARLYRGFKGAPKIEIGVQPLGERTDGFHHAAHHDGLAVGHAALQPAGVVRATRETEVR